MKKVYIWMAAAALAVSIPAIAQAAEDQPRMSDVQHHKTMGAGHHPQNAQVAGDQPSMSDVQHRKTMGAGHHPQSNQKPD